MLTPVTRAVLRISGTRGTVVLEDGAIVSAEFEDEDSARYRVRSAALKMPDGHRAQLADIISPSLPGSPPQSRGEDGYRALKFVLDVYAAAGWGPRCLTING